MNDENVVDKLRDELLKQLNILKENMRVGGEEVMNSSDDDKKEIIQRMCGHRNDGIEYSIKIVEETFECFFNNFN